MLCASVCLVVTSRGLAVKLQTPRHASGDMSGKTSDLYVVGMLGPPETWMVPEAAVSNPARPSRRCSSPSTVDSAARRACYEQPGPALPGARAAAGGRPTSAINTLAMKARVLTLEEVQVHAMLATVHDDAYSEYMDLESMEEMRERVGRDARRDVT